jgi:hypothetical protein
MTMKGLIVIVLLLLQGCATWTVQDTQNVLGAIAIGAAAGLAIGVATQPRVYMCHTIMCVTICLDTHTIVRRLT